MKKFVLFSLYLLFQSYAYSLSSFRDFNPRSQSFKAERFPREGRVLYRGMQKYQFELDKALQALLGDESSLIESKFFSTIRSRLQGEVFPVAVALPYSVEEDIRGELDRHGKLGFDQAVKKTIEIVDDYFNSLSRSRKISQYLNYDSGEYIDWPNDIVFSTIVQPGAATYGYNLAMIKEDEPRSIDLNYFNYVMNSKWYNYTRDVGEFAAYGYIPTQDIIGFQLRDESGDKGWHKIRYVFMKRAVGHESYVEIYSGYYDRFSTLSSCVAPDDQGDLFHCAYRPGSIALEAPSLSSDQLKPMGYILSCGEKESDTDCKDRYSLSPVSQKGSLSRDVKSKVKQAKLKGKRILTVLDPS